MKVRSLCLSVCVTLTGVFIIISLTWESAFDEVTYSDWQTEQVTVSRKLPLNVSHYDVAGDPSHQGTGSFRYTSVETTDTTYPPDTSPQPYQEQQKMSLILKYNSTSKYIFKNCEYSACAMTSDLEKADLVMFGAAKMNSFKPPRKLPGQIWLLYTRGPPLASGFNYLANMPDLIDKFNWTKTVHPDSTFWNIYGHLVLKTTLPSKDYKSIYRKKIHDVAWFVSHCETQSKRAEYIRRMMSEIDVHVFGACGNLTCGRRGYTMGGEIDVCLSMLSENYKFYLAFESTLCEGYVSEKFFNMFNGPGVDIIPVVRNGANNHQRFPPGISIISSDFPSPESLGKYLYSLARDEERYIELLKNKDRYTTGKFPTNFECELCKALHLRQPVNVIHNIADWLHRPEMCWPPNDL